jgi:ribose transport system permease protein
MALGLRATSSAVWVTLLCALLVAIFSVLSPEHAFFSQQTFTNVSLSSAQIVLLCVAQAMLLGAGHIDISQGGVIVFSSVIGGTVVQAVTGVGSDTIATSYSHLGLAIVVAVAAATATGALIGAANGLFVARLRLNSLVVTLATLGIASGAAQLITNGANLSGLPTSLQTGFGIKSVGGWVPLPALVSAAIVAIVWVAFAKTRFGLRTLAIGSNVSAAERAGVPVGWHVVRLFALSGLVAGVAGVIDLTRFATTDIGGHQNDALAAIAGAVIGGTSLQGGRASVGGAIVGALLAVILQIGLVVLNLSPFYQTIAIGAVLLVAITVDRLLKARKDS